MTKRYFAGIGARKTPDNILETMSDISRKLTSFGFILRSGHAEGADWAFERSALKANIYLPWPSFNEATLPYVDGHTYECVDTFDKEAHESVYKFHPTAKYSAKFASIGRLMARNYRQVIGNNEPNSEFVICWTKNGKDDGGTGQAIRIANHFKIPVYNLFNKEDLDKVYEIIKEAKKSRGY